MKGDERLAGDYKVKELEQMTELSDSNVYVLFNVPQGYKKNSPDMM